MGETSTFSSCSVAPAFRVQGIAAGGARLVDCEGLAASGDSSCPGTGAAIGIDRIADRSVAAASAAGVDQL